MSVIRKSEITGDMVRILFTAANITTKMVDCCIVEQQRRVSDPPLPPVML